MSAVDVGVDVDVDVVVVGAGIGGLATARALLAAGRSVRVLEARERVGGRLDAVDGLDLGATWFWPGESRVAALVADLGLASFEQHLAGNARYQDAAGVQELRGNPIDVASFRISGGAASLAPAVANSLPGGVISLGDPVTAIAAESHTGPLGVTTASHQVRADHVVLAIPPPLAAGIALTPQPSPEIARLMRTTPVWMGSMTKVVAVYDVAFWRSHGWSGSAISQLGPLREIHDMSGPVGRPAALFGFVPPGGPPVSEAAVIDQLVAIFGGEAASPTQVHVRDWRDEPWTSPPQVEHLTTYELMGDQRYQVPLMGGRLHWASTETASSFGGHIEGALQAAERAVTAIVGPLTSIGKRPDRHG